jgi:hypothetical protein
VLFASTESIAKKRKIVAQAGEDLSTFTTGDMDPVSIALNNKMEALAVRRQKGSRFLKLTSWALYHRSEFKDLLEQIVSLIDNIENLFPAPKLKSHFFDKKQQKLVTEHRLTSSRTQARAWTFFFRQQYDCLIDVGNHGRCIRQACNYHQQRR